MNTFCISTVLFCSRHRPSRGLVTGRRWRWHLVARPRVGASHTASLHHLAQLHAAATDRESAGRDHEHVITFGDHWLGRLSRSLARHSLLERQPPASPAEHGCRPRETLRVLRAQAVKRRQLVDMHKRHALHCKADERSGTAWEFDTSTPISGEQAAALAEKTRPAQKRRPAATEPARTRNTQKLGNFTLALLRNFTLALTTSVARPAVRRDPRAPDGRAFDEPLQRRAGLILDLPKLDAPGLVLLEHFDSSGDHQRAVGAASRARRVGSLGPVRYQGDCTSKFLVESRCVSYEFKAIFRHLRRPPEPSSLRQLVVHELHDVRGDSPEHREVLRAVVRPVPKVVLSHPDIQNPMQVVLDRPAVPDGLQELLGGHLPAHEAAGVSVLVRPPTLRTASILPTAARPGQPWRSCSQPMSQETVAVRVSMRPWPRSSS